MKPPEEVRDEFVRQWVAKAELDYKTARHLLMAGDAYAAPAAFHAQQAAEKYVKALLVNLGTEFPKTHSLAALLDLLIGRMIRRQRRQEKRTERSTA